MHQGRSFVFIEENEMDPPSSSSSRSNSDKDIAQFNRKKTIINNLLVTFSFILIFCSLFVPWLQVRDAAQNSAFFLCEEQLKTHSFAYSKSTMALMTRYEINAYLLASITKDPTIVLCEPRYFKNYIIFGDVINRFFTPIPYRFYVNQNGTGGCQLEFNRENNSKFDLYYWCAYNDTHDIIRKYTENMTYLDTNVTSTNQNENIFRESIESNHKKLKNLFSSDGLSDISNTDSISINKNNSSSNKKDRKNNKYSYFDINHVNKLVENNTKINNKIKKFQKIKNNCNNKTSNNNITYNDNNSNNNNNNSNKNNNNSNKNNNNSNKNNNNSNKNNNNSNNNNNNSNNNNSSNDNSKYNHNNINNNSIKNYYNYSDINCNSSNRTEFKDNPNSSITRSQSRTLRSGLHVSADSTFDESALLSQGEFVKYEAVKFGFGFRMNNETEEKKPFWTNGIAIFGGQNDERVMSSMVPTINQENITVFAVGAVCIWIPDIYSEYLKLAQEENIKYALIDLDDRVLIEDSVGALYPVFINNNSQPVWPSFDQLDSPFWSFVNKKIKYAPFDSVVTVYLNDEALEIKDEKTNKTKNINSQQYHNYFYNYNINYNVENNNKKKEIKIEKGNKKITKEFYESRNKELETPFGGSLNYNYFKIIKRSIKSKAAGAAYTLIMVYSLEKRTESLYLRTTESFLACFALSLALAAFFACQLSLITRKKEKKIEIELKKIQFGTLNFFKGQIHKAIERLRKLELAFPEELMLNKVVDKAINNMTMVGDRLFSVENVYQNNYPKNKVSPCELCNHLPSGYNPQENESALSNASPPNDQINTNINSSLERNEKKTKKNKKKKQEEIEIYDSWKFLTLNKICKIKKISLMTINDMGCFGGGGYIYNVFGENKNSILKSDKKFSKDENEVFSFFRNPGKILKNMTKSIVEIFLYFMRTRNLMFVEFDPDQMVLFIIKHFEQKIQTKKLKIASIYCLLEMFEISKFRSNRCLTNPFDVFILLFSIFMKDNFDQKGNISNQINKESILNENKENVENANEITSLSNLVENIDDLKEDDFLKYFNDSFSVNEYKYRSMLKYLSNFFPVLNNNSKNCNYFRYMVKELLFSHRYSDGFGSSDNTMTKNLCFQLFDLSSVSNFSIRVESSDFSMINNLDDKILFMKTVLTLCDFAPFLIEERISVDAVFELEKVIFTQSERNDREFVSKFFVQMINKIVRPTFDIFLKMYKFDVIGQQLEANYNRILHPE